MNAPSKPQLNRSRPSAAGPILALALVAVLLAACGLAPEDTAVPDGNAAGATTSPATGPSPAATTEPQPASPSPTPGAPTARPSPTTSPATALPSRSPDAGPGDTGIGDPYFPDMGNGGYDALHYDLTLSVDPAVQTVEGSSSMRARATQPLRSFYLDFEQLTIEELLVDGQATAYEHEGDQLLVKPGRPLASGAEFSVQVTYRGRPAPSSDPAVLSGWFWTAGVGTVAAEPFGAQTWFPANDHPLDKATYRLTVTVPRPFVVASNGLLIETAEDDEEITYVWEARDPIASYLVTVSIDEYEIHETETASGLPLVSFFAPGEAAAAEAAIAPTAAMIDYFAGLFGPYPFEVYGVVAVQGRLPAFAALETQTRSLFFDVPLNEDILAHELAHQWFGDSVSLETWQDLWLKEGMATYAEYLWLERSNGRAAVDDIVASLHNELVQGTRAGFYQPPGRPLPEDLYGFPVYQGGAVVLHALRTTVGDEAFFKTLQAYTARFAYGNASTADLEALAEEVSGQELSDFFQAWLYHSPPPDFPRQPAPEGEARRQP